MRRHLRVWWGGMPASESTAGERDMTWHLSLLMPPVPYLCAVPGGPALHGRTRPRLKTSGHSQRGVLARGSRAHGPRLAGPVPTGMPRLDGNARSGEPIVSRAVIGG